MLFMAKRRGQRISGRGSISLGERLKEIITVAILYFITGAIGLFFAVPPGYATALWPPAGLAFAALLLLGNRVWPGIWLGSLLVNTIVPAQDLTTAALLTAFVIGGGSTLQALLGAFLFRRFIDAPHPFGRVSHATSFFFVTLLMCLVAATVGVTTLFFTGLVSATNYLTNWLTWYLGDAVGILLFTPFILAWVGGRKVWPGLPGESALVEAPAILILLALVGQIAFVSNSPISYIIIPIVVWAVFSFGPRGGTAATLFTSAMATWWTVNGLGPFVQAELYISLLFIQLFVAVVSLTTLLTAAAIAESKRSRK